MNAVTFDTHAAVRKLRAADLNKALRWFGR